MRSVIDSIGLPPTQEMLDHVRQEREQYSQAIEAAASITVGLVTAAAFWGPLSGGFPNIYGSCTGRQQQR